MTNANTEYLVTFKAMRADGSVSVTVYGWALSDYIKKYSAEIANVTLA